MNNDKIINIPDLSDLDLMNLPEIRCQIEELTEGIESICLESLKWNNDDFLCVFLTGVLGGVADILIGKPGGYEQPKSRTYRSLGEKIKAETI